MTSIRRTSSLQPPVSPRTLDNSGFNDPDIPLGVSPELWMKMIHQCKLVLGNDSKDDKLVVAEALKAVQVIRKQSVDSTRVMSSSSNNGAQTPLLDGKTNNGQFYDYEFPFKEISEESYLSLMQVKCRDDLFAREIKSIEGKRERERDYTFRTNLKEN